MPIYEFRCAGCGQVFEELVLAGLDRSQTACPACGDTAVAPVMSTFSPAANLPCPPAGPAACSGASAGGCATAGGRFT